MKGEELEQQALKSACEKECCLRALAALVPVSFVGVLLECFALEHCCWNASKEGHLTSDFYLLRLKLPRQGGEQAEARQGHTSYLLSGVAT